MFPLYIELTFGQSSYNKQPKSPKPPKEGLFFSFCFLFFFLGGDFFPPGLLIKDSLPGAESRQHSAGSQNKGKRHLGADLLQLHHCEMQHTAPHHTDTYKLLGPRLPAQPQLDIACSNYLDQMQFICFIFAFPCSPVTYKCHCSVYLL